MGGLCSKPEETEKAKYNMIETKKAKHSLIVIDPQVDFHDGGSLAVPGAVEDSARTADFIRKHILDLDEIFITLDTHHVGCWRSFLF